MDGRPRTAGRGGVERGLARPMKLKAALRAAPIIGALISKLRPVRYIEDPARFWEDHYRAGGNSGPGSYNRLAAFKAEFLNEFVAKNGVQSVIEFGSGDGAQLSLADYPSYLGVDVAPTAVELCRRRFAGQANRAFVHTSELAEDATADLTLSLDVIFHLVDDAGFDSYLRQLFDASRRWVIIYASNVERAQGPLMRHRKFTDWIERHRPDFTLQQAVPNRYPFDPADPQNTSCADFFVFRRAGGK
jgi:hypothetical protein